MCSADGGPRPLFFSMYSAGPLYLDGYDLYSMQSDQRKHVGPTTAPSKKKTEKLNDQYTPDKVKHLLQLWRATRGYDKIRPEGASEKAHQSALTAEQ